MWELSEELGLKAFKKQAKDSIFDDHVPLYEIAGIPAINIIDFDYPYWHTLEDTPDKCSAKTLQIVGHVVSEYIYRSNNNFRNDPSKSSFHTIRKKIK